MSDYTSITDWSFKFANHPHCLQFILALNNTYAEDLDDAAIVLIFTNAHRMIVTTDPIPILWAAIVDVIMISSTVDRAVVVQIINQMLLFAFIGNPGQKYPFCSAVTITKALNMIVAANKTSVVIQLNPVQIFVGEIEVEVEGELQFYVYSFAKMEEKTLKVLPTRTRLNFCLQIEHDPQYNRAYVLDSDAKSSALK